MTWNGVPLNTRTAAMMDEVEAILGYGIYATQGSPSTSVGASAGTHNGEGVIDVDGPDLDTLAAAMRQVGFAAWHRTVAQGFAPHVHGVAVGEPLLSSAAAQQVASYFDGRNGLANNGVDDGPRTWVGVTWETYTGGTPLPTGSRPTGTPFWGESLPFEDSYVLAGSPAWMFVDGSSTVYTASGFAAQLIGTGSGREGDEFVRCVTGDTILWIASNNGTYLAGGEVPEFAWVIRARGTGTLAVRDDIDPSWSYSTPANALAGVTVSGSGWVEYSVPTTTPNVTSILAGDGQRVSVEVTGAVDIDRVCLAVTPVGGVVGKFSDPLSGGTAEVLPGRNSGSSSGYGGQLGGADWNDAWAEAVGDVGDVIAIPGSQYIDAGYGATQSSSGDATWSLTVGVSPVSVNLTSVTPSPSGVEGIDFIRRPDRTVYDEDRFIQYGSGLPAVASWANSVVSFNPSTDDLPSTYALKRIGYLTLTGTATPAPGLLGGTGLATADGSTRSQSAISLAGAGSAFTLVLSSSWVTDDPGTAAPSLSSFIGQMSAYLGDADFDADPSTWQPLKAVVGIPDYSVWKPGLYSAGRLDDPDGGPGLTVVTYLRNKQRNDGLGAWSATRSRGVSSQQRSIRNRGYR